MAWMHFENNCLRLRWPGLRASTSLSPRSCGFSATCTFRILKLDRQANSKLTIRRMFAPSSSSTASSGGGSSTTPSRRPSFSSASSATGAPPRRFPPRHVQVAETADEDEGIPGEQLEGDDGAADDGALAGEASLEEVLQTEVENLGGDRAG